MPTFEERVSNNSDHFFVKEDPARIYRGLKDLLVDEFDMDRIEEGHMEFNVSKPKDRIRLFAFKEKSPHTVLRFYVNFKAKEPRDVYKVDRPEGVLKARVKVKAEVVTMFPGRETITWLPTKLVSYPYRGANEPGLRAEEKTSFQKSKLYRILTGIWYNVFYSKEIERYEEEAEEIAVRIRNLMREKFGIEKSVHRSGATQYNPPWK